jgi:hypothetical protein
MKFAKFQLQMIPPLRALAEESLRKKKYERLRVVAEWLVLFDTDAWRSASELHRLRMLQKMEIEFGERFWADQKWSCDSAYTEVCLLIAAEKRGYEPKKQTA